MSKTILLIDTSALIYRSYHAIPPLTNSKGEAVNAVYGVATTLLSVIKELQPTAVIAAFDVKKPTFRHKMFDAYKAKRKKTPDDLIAQFPYVTQLIDALGISALSQDGFEADDIIGTLAHQITTSDPDAQIIIVTGDNDALGLVNNQIKVRTFGRGIKDVKIYDTDGVRAKYQLEPAQLADFKGLAGDSSDNIPGVTGIGAVGAAKLLQKYQTLEGIYDNIDQITGALGDKLRRDREQALLSKKLGTICIDIDLGVKYDDLRKVISSDVKFEITALNAQKFFDKMSFYSLTKRLTNSGEVPAKKPSTKKTQYSIATTDQQINDLRKTINATKQVAFWVATDNTQEKQQPFAQIDGISFSTSTNSATFIPLNEQTKPQIAQIFQEATDLQLVTYNYKQTLKLLHSADIDCPHIIQSALLESYLLNAGTKQSLAHSVADLLSEQLPPEIQTQLSLLGEPIKDQEALSKNANAHADYIAQIHTKLSAQIAQIAKKQIAQTNCPPVNIANLSDNNWNLQTVLDKMELPLVPILATMELCGIQFDKEKFDNVTIEIAQKLKELEQQIHQDADSTFNIKSPKQLAQILFEDLQLSTKGIKKTKTGYSTAADELDKLRKLHPIIDKISSYRELAKLKSTYIDVLPTLVADDGRIHSSFHQTVTATGRLSSSDPNLQNIPTRGTYARTIRSAFVATSGYTFVSADYSQIDLRCVAHIANDQAMIAAFIAGEDIHCTTAAAINNVKLSEVTKQMRFSAKELNFGLIYGMGSFGFARSAGIDHKSAQKFIDAYFAKFTGVAKYMQDTIKSAKENGFVATPFGRQRKTIEINSPNAQIAKSGERMAINMPIQGFASDIMKLAMIAVADEYNLTNFAQNPTNHSNATNTPVHMVLQIHDEIILEVKTEIASEVAQTIKTIMENIVTLKVPLLVETTTSPTWAGLK